MATLNRVTFACYVNQDSSKLLFFLLLFCKSSIPFGKPFAKAFLFAFDRTGGFYQVKAYKKSRNALWQRQIGKFLCKNGQYSFPACYGMWYLCCSAFFEVELCDMLLYFHKKSLRFGFILPKRKEKGDYVKEGDKPEFIISSLSL